MRGEEIGVFVELNEGGGFVLVGSDSGVGSQNGDNLGVVFNR